MPFTQKDLDELPISFCTRKEETWVTVGPGSAMAFKGKKIPLDGRQYKCAGTIWLKNGLELRASFSITTTTFDFIILNSLYIPVEGTWYRWDEPELATALGTEHIEPTKWQTDKPLDYAVNPPYTIQPHIFRK